MTKREDPGHVVPIEHEIYWTQQSIKELAWEEADPCLSYPARMALTFRLAKQRGRLSKLQSRRDAGETVEVMFCPASLF